MNDWIQLNKNWKINTDSSSKTKLHLFGRKFISVETFQSVEERDLNVLFIRFNSLAKQNAQCNTGKSTRRQSNIENDPGNEFTKATTSCIINPKINSILEHNEKEMNKRDQEYENHVELSPICVEIEGDYSSWEEVSKKQKQVTGESLSSNYSIERVLSELPRSQADVSLHLIHLIIVFVLIEEIYLLQLDSFVFPFPIEHDELFRDYFWTSERRKDMSLVNKLIQNFINYKSLKTKLLSEGLFTMVRFRYTLTWCFQVY